MTPHIYVVVPVHNRVAYTLSCLADLETQTHLQHTVVLVDDGSTDGTASRVRSEFPEVVLLSGNGDLWWTGATNRGIEWVLDCARDADLVLTLNNDTRVGPEYLSILAGAALKYPGTLIGSVAVDSRDGQTIVDGGVFVNWWTARYRPLNRGRSVNDVRAELANSMQESDVLSGRGTLVPVSVLRHLGPYAEGLLPHYGADYEYSRRAARAGYSLRVDYDAVVISEIAATGMRADARRLNVTEFLSLFVSKRSSANLRYRWNYARLVCPRQTTAVFFLCDMGRVVLSGLRSQLSPRAMRRM